jgi:hypothetical protein
VNGIDRHEAGAGRVPENFPKYFGDPAVTLAEHALLMAKSSRVQTVGQPAPEYGF